MFEKIEMMRMVHAMGQHVSQRQLVVARNIANADTPGYRAADMQDFDESYRRTLVGDDLRVTNPRHLDSPQWALDAARVIDTGQQASPNGNSVSIEEEMVRAAETKRDSDLSLGIYRSALDLMRTSLGRG
ncbi:FlgB family protein [Paracoccus sp. JM45]|uniref:FlgB family protein n=1 Tax=Paracoccus sp. JM45 TaxID=2283626 RepID=UPI000E6C8D87|nr:FlgB family protein [Paracoccus sp. JM45]RJE80359.1 FlgB family protein [Paracoccus sp. JM45]